MYRIGREYYVLSHRTALDYLRLCYETSRKWFTTGPYNRFGLITGLNAVNIVDDLKSEGWQQEYETILALMKETNQAFLTDPYPYSSTSDHLPCRSPHQNANTPWSQDARPGSPGAVNCAKLSGLAIPASR
jgi:hypothetical protein